MHTHSRCIIDPSKGLRTVPGLLLGVLGLLLGVSYLGMIKFLHCWLPFSRYHQNRLQSTWMLKLLLLEFLGLLLDDQKLERHLTSTSTRLYLTISWDLSSLLPVRRAVEGKGTCFLYSLSVASDPRICTWQNFDTTPPTPTVRIIVLKSNTDSLWSCLSLTPDSENYSQCTVNSERNGQPDSSPRSLQNGTSKHLQHLKMAEEVFWHQHVWHAALKTRSILTCVLLDFLY